MISDKKKILDKLNKIEMLLNDETTLDKYIEEIDEKELNMPINLQSKLLSNTERKFNIKVFVVEQYANILKIAACTIFAILMWENTLPKDFGNSKPFEMGIKQSSIYASIDNTLKNINSFFTKPINLNKEERK